MWSKLGEQCVSSSLQMFFAVTQPSFAIPELRSRLKPKEHHFLSTFSIWTRPGKKVLLKVRPLDVRQNLYMFFISKLNFYVACARVLHLYELPMILTPARWASFTMLIMSPGSTPFNTGCLICAER